MIFNIYINNELYNSNINDKYKNNDKKLILPL
jgi:hypothetical protein